MSNYNNNASDFHGAVRFTKLFFQKMSRTQPLCSESPKITNIEAIFISSQDSQQQPPPPASFSCFHRAAKIILKSENLVIVLSIPNLQMPPNTPPRHSI